MVTGIGAFLAAVVAIVAALFGFLWFPVKRLVAKLRGDDGGLGESAENGGPVAGETTSKVRVESDAATDIEDPSVATSRESARE